MSAIDRTIWMIEARFRDPPGLDELAAHAGVSRSHLSRIFPAATGHTVFGYLRGRRLTEAARAVAAGADDLLAVALEAGYGSHEAFTRAFRDQFGMTPDEVRRMGSTDHLPMVEPLPMMSETRLHLPPPRLFTHRAFQLAGIGARLDMSQPNSISALWQDFAPYIGHVPGAVAGPAYGVVLSANETSCDYLCALEVTDTSELPRAFRTVQVPARHWAAFQHRGHISTIRSTIRAIYAHGLVNARLTQAEGVSFIEYYGPDFDGRTGMGTCEIWIGVEG